MIITGIQVQKKNPRRASVFIDGEFAFGLSDVDCLYYRLREGRELSEAEYDFLRGELMFIRAKESAFTYLGSSVKCISDVRNKLKSKEYTEEIIDEVIEALIEYKYLDDRQYALLYAQDKISAGYGSVKINYELGLKNINREYIDEALENTEQAQTECAVRLLERKFRTFLGDYPAQIKASQFLYRRGFSQEISTAAIRGFSERSRGEPC